MAAFEGDLKAKLMIVINKMISTNILKVIANKAVDLVRVRTRLGYGVSFNNGPRGKLSPLSRSYKKQRKYMPSLATEKTSPTKSNLTLTGNMLDSLDFKISGSIAQVSPQGKFNIQKAKWAHEGSSNRPQRPFLRLSNNEIRQLNQLFSKEIQRVLRLFK